MKKCKIVFKISLLFKKQKIVKIILVNKGLLNNYFLKIMNNKPLQTNNNYEIGETYICINCIITKLS